MIRGLDMNKAAASCKVIADKGDFITSWVCRGLGFDSDWVGEHFTIGFMVDGELIGGLIYHNIRPGRDVWWTLYTIDKRWCTRSVLRFMFGLAFDYYGCRRISMQTDIHNDKCQKLALKLGFEYEGVLKEFRDDGHDAVIMGITRNNCNF